MAKGAKPAVRRRRRTKRGGRPRIIGAERTKSGRLTRAEQRRRAVARERETMSVALKARRRHLGLSQDDARHHDAPIVAWRWWKRGEIQERHFNAAVALGRLHADYLKAIRCPGLARTGTGRASTDIEGTEPAYVAWCDARRRAWLAVRRDLLDAGPLTFSAAQAVALENREVVSLVGEFRAAMNIAARALGIR